MDNKTRLIYALLGFNLYYICGCNDHTAKLAREANDIAYQADDDTHRLRSRVDTLEDAHLADGITAAKQQADSAAWEVDQLKSRLSSDESTIDSLLSHVNHLEQQANKN